MRFARIHAVGEFFTRLKDHYFPGRNEHRVSRSWIPSLALLLPAHLKTTESAKVNLLSVAKRLADGGNHRVDRIFCLRLAPLRARGKPVDQVASIHSTLNIAQNTLAYAF
jgi:hypothetical protein